MNPQAISSLARTSFGLGLLAIWFNFFTAIPAIVFGFQSLRRARGCRETGTSEHWAIMGLLLACLCTAVNTIFVWGVAASAREAAERSRAANRLELVGRALHTYAGECGTFPSAGFAGPLPTDGRPRPADQSPNLSWRVAILPSIDKDLFERFNLDEPWDGPNNIKLLAEMPRIYRLPGDEQSPPGYTHFVALVGNGAAFEPDRGVRLDEFLEKGTSNVIMVVTAEQAVPWTKPEDIAFDPVQPLKPLLSRQYRDGTVVLFADGGSRHTVPPTISEDSLKAFVSRRGKAPENRDW